MMEQEFVKIEGNSSLVRDKISKSIINTSESERQAYLNRKKAIQSKDNKIDMMEKRIADLEAKVKVLMDALNK